MLTLFILCGYPFAGKSTLARKLVEKLGLTRIALDDINTEGDIGVDLSKSISAKEWQHNYDTYYHRIKKNLQQGNSVIVDTVAHKRESRDDLKRLAEDNNAKSLILYIATPLDEVKARWLKNRQTKKRSDVSDESFYEVINSFEAPEASEEPITILPDTTTEDVMGLISGH